MSHATQFTNDFFALELDFRVLLLGVFGWRAAHVAQDFLSNQVCNVPCRHGGDFHCAGGTFESIVVVKACTESRTVKSKHPLNMNLIVSYKDAPRVIPRKRWEVASSLKVFC